MREASLRISVVFLNNDQMSKKLLTPAPSMSYRHFEALFVLHCTILSLCDLILSAQTHKPSWLASPSPPPNGVLNCAIVASIKVSHSCISGFVRAFEWRVGSRCICCYKGRARSARHPVLHCPHLSRDRLEVLEECTSHPSASA